MVQIQITNQSGEILYLDINEGTVNIPLNYSIDDIRKIESKNASYSKNFILPGTKHNNNVFGNLFDINTSFDAFNPNLRIDAVILQDSIPLIQGYLQLKKIIKDNTTDFQGNRISYEVIVFDASVDFFQSLGDELLRELDLTAYDHTFNKDNIQAAWGNNFNDIYQYPLLDKVDKNYFITDFKPAFYHKGLLNLIAAEKGYTLEGSFMDNNTTYNKEIILWDGNTPEISKSEGEEREFEAGFTATSVLVASKVRDEYIYWTDELIKAPFNFNDTIFDNPGTYQIDQPITLGVGGTASIYTAPTFGRVDFVIKNRFRVEATADRALEMRETSRSQPAPAEPPKVFVRAMIRDVATNQVLASDAQELGVFEDFAGAGTQVIEDDVVFNRLNNRILSEGQQVYVEFQLICDINFCWIDTSVLPTAITPVDIDFIAYNTLTTSAASVWYNETVLSVNSIINQPTKLSGYLPKEIKKKDLFADIIKGYNVYIRPSATKANTLILESRYDFYNTTKVIDWTSKKDYSKEDQITFLTELQKKEIIFTYKDDSGAEGADGLKWAETYTKSTGDLYGQKKVNFENEFVKDSQTIERVFSTAPLLFRDINNVIVPAVSIAEGKRNPVIAYWGGLKSVKDGLEDNKLLGFGWSSTGGTGTTITLQSEYPYAGHYDDPYTPTVDIHYGEVTNEYYKTLKNTTDNNLFNNYWKNYIEQIGDGKLVTSYFYLTPSDINYIKDNLETRIFVKDSYYNINKIIDYNPLKNELTKVELLKINVGSSFTPTSGGLSNIKLIKPISISSVKKSSGAITTSNNNIINSPNAIVVGEGNYIGEDVTGIINGNNNIIGSNSSNVNIQGNNNVIESGVENVSIIGDNQTIETSNTSSINGNTFTPDNPVSGLWEAGIGESVLQVCSPQPNNIEGDWSFVTGNNNEIIANTSAIVGGLSNFINGTDFSAIIGGQDNTIDPFLVNTVIVGGANNTLTGSRSAIIGGDSITSSLDDCVTVPSISFAEDTTKKWVFKELEIGDWDIVTTNGVTVPHGLSVSEWKTIRSVSVIIRNDADTVYFDFDFTIYSTFIGLTRANDSSFINPNFVLTPYNRGWVTFWYKPD